MTVSKTFAMRTERCDFMLAAVKGYSRDNTVVIEDEDMRACDGAEAVVTLLDPPKLKRTEKILIGIALSCRVREESMLMNI